MSIINQVSPGIQVSEVDLTGYIPGVSTSTGAFAGQFNWGPCDVPVLLSNEAQLVSTFGKPSANTSETFSAQSFFSAANFLAYSNSLYTVRSVSNTAINASTANTAANVTVTIKNAADYEANFLNQNNSNTYGTFAAKYPGSIGSGLKVSVCANTVAFSTWDYKSYFTAAPGTSNFSVSAGNPTANDELHIVVVDSQGKFSGVANTVLEKFAFLSKAQDAKDVNGQSNYYKQSLLQNSAYVYAMDPPQYANTSSTWGGIASETPSFAILNTNYTYTLGGGANGGTTPDGDLQNSWNKLIDRETYDYSLVFTGTANTAVSQHVYDNVVSAGELKTAVMFVSPRLDDVVNQAGSEVANIVTNADSFINTFSRESSYIVADCNWKYQLDRYNNIYRWMPINPDIAGLCAAVDQSSDPWTSPGGLTNGKIKNAVKLAWNPTKAERDVLYNNGVNPVVSFKGQGTILFGDKTLQSRPSAFDRIGVRRLFITIEKAISDASKYMLFQNNTPATRAQFISMIEPYLRLVQGRGGIANYKVICDDSNNTAQVISMNGFVGDIYILPNQSINFIQLNFIATKSGVEFSTITG